VAKPHDGNGAVHFPNHSLDGARQRSRWQRGPHHHVHAGRSDAVLVKGNVEFRSCRALHAVLPDVAGYSDHRMTDIIARAKRPTRRPQTPANGILSLPDSFRQSLIDDGYLALGCVVGSLEAAPGDDRDAHGPEIVAHDELVVVDDFEMPSV